MVIQQSKRFYQFTNTGIRVIFLGWNNLSYWANFDFWSKNANLTRLNNCKKHDSTLQPKGICHPVDPSGF